MRREEEHSLVLTLTFYEISFQHLPRALHSPQTGSPLHPSPLSFSISPSYPDAKGQERLHTLPTLFFGICFAYIAAVWQANEMSTGCTLFYLITNSV